MKQESLIVFTQSVQHKLLQFAARLLVIAIGIRLFAHACKLAFECLCLVYWIGEQRL